MYDRFNICLIITNSPTSARGGATKRRNSSWKVVRFRRVGDVSLRSLSHQLTRLTGPKFVKIISENKTLAIFINYLEGTMN